MGCGRGSEEHPLINTKDKPSNCLGSHALKELEEFMCACGSLNDYNVAATYSVGVVWWPRQNCCQLDRPLVKAANAPKVSIDGPGQAMAREHKNLAAEAQPPPFKSSVPRQLRIKTLAQPVLRSVQGPVGPRTPSTDVKC